MSDIFDVNALEREAKHEPFRFKVGREVFTLKHPEDLDIEAVGAAQDAALAGNPVPMFRAYLGEEYDKFAKHRVAAWKVGEILKAASEHYGITPGK